MSDVKNQPCPKRGDKSDQAASIAEAIHFLQTTTDETVSGITLLVGGCQPLYISRDKAERMPRVGNSQKPQ